MAEQEIRDNILAVCGSITSCDKEIWPGGFHNIQSIYVKFGSHESLPLYHSTDNSATAGKSLVLTDSTTDVSFSSDLKQLSSQLMCQIPEIRKAKEIGDKKKKRKRLSQSKNKVISKAKRAKPKV